ncbi:ArsR/SmtB family transcription factor [Salinisphaera orenii]|uniref:ArsR/SmtB family transcription factor n=1 Tax=Salinisphaera orenii TaxID=856731 RepID=UPI000DBE2069
MKTQHAVTLLSALGNETRLDVFRYLTRFGPEGVAAKTIAEGLGVAPNSLSFHLKDLKHAGLVVSHRTGREVHYAVDYAATHGLVAFLIEHCCEIAPEGCPPACRPGTEDS